MKKKIIKLFKRIFYSLPSSYILMLHHVDKECIESRSSCHLSYDSFISLIDSGIRFCKFEECTGITQKLNKSVCLTFDDGLKDLYTVVYPELKKRNIPFLAFIVTDFLDQKGYITTEELKRLAADPLVTIGAHGVSHKILSDLSIDEQRKELENSKATLEEILGVKINYFAFSHGKYNSDTLELLKNYRLYDYAFGVVPRPYNLITHQKYALPRINCDDNNKRFIVKSKKIEFITSD